METIKEWFTGNKDYMAGLILLAKHSKNRILLQHLSRKTCPEKLEYELNKICKGSVNVPAVSDRKELHQSNNEDTIHTGGKPKIDPADLPVHLKKLWDETAEKYRLARAIHEQLKLMTKADHRAPLIKQLENYRKETRANWDIIDAWVLEQKQGTKMAPIDEKRINANRKYLSEGKRAVAALFGAVRAKKLEAMQLRINELLSVGEKFDPNNQKELEELGMKFNG